MEIIDFREFLESTGKELQARIDRAVFYRHKTGVGDAREDVVRDYLSEVLPPRFAVDRGKFFDKEGQLSREFDVIISESIDVSPAMVLAGRRIVPVESVYGVIEVKSKLNKRDYDNFIEAVAEMDKMQRYYEPYYNPLSPEEEDRLAKGFPPQDQSVGKIWSGIIAIDAPQEKTISHYLNTCCEGFCFICISGKEFIFSVQNQREFLYVPCGLMSLPLTIWFIMELVTKNKRPRFLMPNFSRYREKIVESMGSLQGWRSTHE